MWECPECRESGHDTVPLFCPKCGTPIKVEEKPKEQTITGTITFTSGTDVVVTKPFTFAINSMEGMESGCTREERKAE